MITTAETITTILAVITTAETITTILAAITTVETITTILAAITTVETITTILAAITMMETITTIILAVITEITTQVAITIMAEATLLLSQFLLLIGALNLSVLQIQNEIRRTNLTQTILNLAQILPSGMCHLMCQ